MELTKDEIQAMLVILANEEWLVALHQKLTAEMNALITPPPKLEIPPVAA